eukprot:TRINITY_DN88882_c0_g1_i1.p1 TRINITY_DN88882_c0_g1~~TRINITY_DN88882_c0_g1_i1.p1  ORF type:complete len:1571 (-),score=289.58 TRINITY_DN88882_c0_g1_i1:80-4792(-)
MTTQEQAWVCQTTGGSGTALILQALKQISEEDDHRHAQASDWDPQLVELTAAVKTRIPRIVEENCRAARHRTNCGIIAQIHYAWASADGLLHIWNYHREDPQVLLVPADSAIVSVGFCVPRPAVFDRHVQLLLVVCTRLTVSLVGLHYAPPERGLCTRSTSDGQATQPHPLGSQEAACGVLCQMHGPFGASRTGTDGCLQLVPLEGYSTRTDGALFHTVRHTSDGHILLASGAPQIYEVAYSRNAGWFTSKCRLVRHVGGFHARVRDFLNISSLSTGRLRILECAPNGYALTADDQSTLRLFKLRDWVVISHRAESVAVLDELAAITVPELAQQVFDQTKQHLASRRITHIFPIMGLDGHLRVQVVTAASERLLLVCSATSAAGPSSAKQQEWPIVKEFESDWTQASQATKNKPGAARTLGLHYGFWLQQVAESKLGHGGTTRTSLAHNPGSAYNQGSVGPANSISAGTYSRQACLEEFREPCVYSNGVWVAVASHAVGNSEIGINVRTDDPEAGTAKSLYKSMMLDSQVLDIAEERDEIKSSMQSGLAGNALAPALAALTASSVDLEGEPSAFRPARSFALLLPDCVHVFKLNFKFSSLSRPPATAFECCLHLAQLTRPQGIASSAGFTCQPGMSCTWSFDDVVLPTFEDQQKHLAQGGCGVPPAQPGRWLQGLLRFLAFVLRPVWDLPLIVSLQGADLSVRQKLKEATGFGDDGLGLALSEDKVKSLLARLRPALRFAWQGLLHEGAVTPGETLVAAVPTTAAARLHTYSRRRSLQSEAVSQARCTLQVVLQVGERAQAVLGLLAVLHSQKSAYRVLHSTILHGNIDKLLTTRLGTLLETDEALDPVVKLCTALVVESGLTTPDAELIFDAGADAAPGSEGKEFGSSGSLRTRRGLRGSKLGMGRDLRGFASAEVCRELEEQCSLIFQKVDLAFVRSRIGSAQPQASAFAVRTAAAAIAAQPLPVPMGQSGTALEILRRYAQCVSPGSPEDHWESLAQSLRNAAGEQPRQAAEICVEKLHQMHLLQEQRKNQALPQAHPDAEARSKQMLEALLGVVSSDALGRPLEDRVLTAQGLVEQLLIRSASLQSSSDRSSTDAADVSFVHRAVLSYLLACPQLKPVLEALLNGHGSGAVSGVESSLVEAFLQERLGESRVAGEVLWKHCLRQGRPQEASGVLLRLAEIPGQSCSLAERIRYLDQARQVATRGLPASKSLLDSLSAKLGAAARVQLPLQREIQIITSDDHLSSGWRSAAEQKLNILDAGLLKLQDLYQVAVEFALYHLTLVIADLSSSAQDSDTGAIAWVSTLLPPQASPYAPEELQVALPAKQHGIFPLLMVRRTRRFLLQENQPVLQPTGTSAHAEDLKLRVLQLLRELGEALAPGSALWNVGCVATLLEYCSCLWYKATDDEGSILRLGDGTRMSCDRAWVALDVLTQKPFQKSLADVIAFYEKVLSHAKSWASDLRQKLPRESFGSVRPSLTDDELYAHLGEVVLGVLERWTTELDGRHANEQSRRELTATWPAVEALLTQLRQGLGELRGDALGSRGRKLIQHADRIELCGQRLCARPPG